MICFLQIVHKKENKNRKPEIDSEVENKVLVARRVQGQEDG